MSRYDELGFFDFEDFVEELNEEELFSVNGGACGAGSSYSPTPHYGGSCAGGGAVTPSYPSSRGGGYTPPSTPPACGGGYTYTPNYTKQNYWDNKFVPKFGDHACAATSLLNEISQQFLKEKGRAMTDYEKTQAMKAAVEGGKIDSHDAYVKNWAEAATLMAESLRMSGRYRETNNIKDADVVVYAYDYKTYHEDTKTYTPGPDGAADHFVSDVGNGKVYDSYDGMIKNLDTSKLQKGRETRLLDYY